MQQLLIPLGIMVGLSLLGWLTQKLKNSQERKQVERDRERRASSPTAPVVNSTPGPKAGAADLNRFMQEIDRLRQRGAPGSAPPAPIVQARPVTKAAPVIAAKKKVRLGDAIPTTFETTAAPTQSRSINPADDLPIASVVSPTFAPPTISPISSKGGAPVVTAAVRSISGATKYKERNTGATTPFGRQLVALLGNSQSLPMAVVLQEILGPPKCQQNPFRLTAAPPEPEPTVEPEAASAEVPPKV
jgi:hypothetical protein